jgi:phage baseplate assembly protein W
MPLYNGFSTINRQKKYHLTDFELAKQDLYNHLRIRKGEKLMNPKFGTIIWDMIFEQLTTEATAAITEDIKAIVSYDPRIKADAINIYEFENGLQLSLDLRYIETDQVDTLIVNFERNAQV